MTHTVEDLNSDIYNLTYYAACEDTSAVTGASQSNQCYTDLSLLSGLHFICYQANFVQGNLVFISWITSNKANTEFEASYLRNA